MSRIAVSVLLVLAVAGLGCAPAIPLDSAARDAAPGPVIRFGVDTFAFPNESRAKNAGKPDLYANYCFVMARAITQFQRFARFDPSGAPLASAAYTDRVRQVIAHAPWDDPLPAAERVVIPGYASLHEFSRGEEAAVKAGLVGRFWTWIHWTNWRVVFPVARTQQEKVAVEILAEIHAGRPVQLLVTNLPAVELNHTVVAYDYRVDGDGDVDLLVYDPNDPRAPGIIRFDRTEKRFVAIGLFDTTPGRIRAFRMYYSPFL
ncbi:MAG: hypothetical protein L0027_01020 [Candidatus Rokubacteria bacterium]|nr:hypothetical protein [Candidatus Rokubacteria bacterium]